MEIQGRLIGIDLHKDMFVACILEEEKKYIKKYKLSEINKFNDFITENDSIAVEMLGYTRNFLKQIKKVKRVAIINTTKFKAISESKKKTDSRDATLLALYLTNAFDKETLSEVRMPEENIAEIRSITHTRYKLVEMRTMLKNKVHAILNMEGILTKKEDFSSKKGLDKVLSYEVNPGARVELEVIVEQIKKLNEGISKLDEEIKSRGSKLKGFENITSIKGIGSNSGTILLSAIANVNDFESEKAIDNYFGMVPSVRQSNKKVRTGRITKQGNKLARTTLVQCTLVAIKYSWYLRAYYERLKRYKGSGKAIIATARKLLHIIYDVLKNDKVFEDFTNYVFKTT